MVVFFTWVFVVILTIILVITVPHKFISKLVREYKLNAKACPIWTETLNTLLDAGADIVDGEYIGHKIIGGAVTVYVGGYNEDSYGAKVSGPSRYVDRRTKKRLARYIALKEAIEILKKAEIT